MKLLSFTSNYYIKLITVDKDVILKNRESSTSNFGLLTKCNDPPGEPHKLFLNSVFFMKPLEYEADIDPLLIKKILNKNVKIYIYVYDETYVNYIY